MYLTIHNSEQNKMNWNSSLNVYLVYIDDSREKSQPITSSALPIYHVAVLTPTNDKSRNSWPSPAEFVSCNN